MVTMKPYLIHIKSHIPNKSFKKMGSHRDVKGKLLHYVRVVIFINPIWHALSFEPSVGGGGGHKSPIKTLLLLLR